MPALLSFLDAILPGEGEGYRCGVAIRSSRTQQLFFDTNAGLADFLERSSADGADAYHACATYTTNTSRAAANAHAAKALWLDLDVGPGKGYATREDASDAIEALANSISLPLPALISSGYGVHAYWPLVQAIDPATWLHYATRLKAACAQFGIHADPSRTSDLASILRPPGTSNYKRNSSALVEAWTDYESCTLDDLAPLLTFTPTARGVLQHAAAHGPLAVAAMHIYTEQLADADAIADQCAQVGAMADTLGLVSEPVWKAVMGVLTFCEGGEEIAHEWSVGDARYDENETQLKYERSLTNTGPTTCKFFEGLDPGKCAGCRFKGTIGSPVQLGRGVEEPVGISTPFAALPAIAGELVQAPPPLPTGFEWHGGALVMKKEKNNSGVTVDMTVTRRPCYLENISKGELKDDKHYYSLRYYTPHEGWRDLEIAAKDLWSAAGMATVAGKGIVIEDYDLFRMYMKAAVHVHEENKRLGMMYEQCGWKENNTAFLVGTRLYRASGVEQVQGTAEVNYRGRMLTPKAGGSLAEWRRCADRLFGVGREAQSFALLASLAAPLIRFLSSDEGGAIVSLVSRKSGKGKTTALAGATSVWGEIHGLQLTNADTAVSKGLTFGVLGNLPVVFDELSARGEKAPELVRNFVEMFTNGRDKMRGTQDGEIRHLLATWQTILITASNTSLVDVITAEDGSTASAYRILEVSVLLPPDVHREGDALKEGLHANQGYAGDFFIKYLVQPEVTAWAQAHVMHTYQELIREHGFKSEHRFWVRTIACCKTAGIIAEKLGLITFPVEPVMQWVLEHCKVASENAFARAAQDETGLDMLTAFMSERIGEILVMKDEAKPNMPQIPRIKPVWKISMRYNIAAQKLYVVERELRQYLAKREFGFSEFVKDLTSLRVLAPKRRKLNLGAGTDFATGAQDVLEISINHPALSQMVTDVRNLTQKEVEAA